MESHKLAFKVFARTGTDIPVKNFVPVFHRWIQGKLLEDHQLIDVADYSHVHQGPGAVLVSHEANIHADLGDGKPGLLYIRKQPGVGSTFSERLRSVFGFAVQAASLLEADPALAGKVKFRTDNPVFLINDRLYAPNTAGTFAAVKSDLEAFLTSVYGGSVKLSYEPHAERLFEVSITAPDVPLNMLIERTIATRI